MTAFPPCSRRCSWWRESSRRHGRQLQATTAAPSRFGSLVDNFCIVDHPIGGNARYFAAQIRAAPAPARQGENPPRPNLTCALFKPAIPGLPAPRRNAHRYHAQPMLLRDVHHIHRYWHECCFAMPGTTLRSLSRSRHGRRFQAGHRGQHTAAAGRPAAAAIRKMPQGIGKLRQRGRRATCHDQGAPSPHRRAEGSGTPAATPDGFK